MEGNDRIEQLKQRHADLLEQLRNLYEENPELGEDAPEGMLDILSEATEDEYEVPDSPSTDDAMAEDEAEPESSLEPDRQLDEPQRPLTPQQRVYRREQRKATARKSRLHARGLGPAPLSPPDSGPEPEEEPVNLDDAVEAEGERDPERDDVRELSDLAFSMQDHNRAMIELFKEMQDSILENTHEMETIRARFARMR